MTATPSLTAVVAGTLLALSVGFSAPLRGAAERLPPAASISLPAPVTSLVALPSTPLVVAGLRSGHIVIWNGRDAAVDNSRKPHMTRVIAVGATADSAEILSLSADGTLVRSRRDSSASGRSTRLNLGPAPPRAAVFSPDGTRVMVGGEFGDIRVFDTVTGALVHELRGHRGELRDLAADTAGQLVSAGAEADLRLWDAVSGRQLAFIDADLTAFALAFNPHGGSLASGGTNRTVTLRDRATLEATAAFTLRAPQVVRTLAWSADGRLLAVGDIDDESLSKGGVQVVEAATKRVVAELDTGGVPVGRLVFLSDGLLVTATERTLRAWKPVAP